MKSTTLNALAQLEVACPEVTALGSRSSGLSSSQPFPEPLGSAPRTATMSLRVQQLRYEADGVISVLLADPTGGTVPAWAPGAHLELELPSGLVRQYSLCGDPDDRHGYRIAVLREEGGRGGSVEIHDTLRVGSKIDVRGPRNNFELVDAEDYVLIGGGIGITPIVSMVRRLTGRRPWRLYYGGRSRRSMAFVDELQRLAGDAAVEITPQDELGLLDLDAILAQVKDESAIYCCGPEPLLTAVEERSTQLGMAERLHLERFSASAAAQAALAESAALGDGFDVELARTGASVRVEPGVTMLDALRTVIPDLPSSCESGVCGTCEVRVLDGVPEHHDLILSDSERHAGSCMLICVSRSRTPKLVLDL